MHNSTAYIMQYQGDILTPLLSGRCVKHIFLKEEKINKNFKSFTLEIKSVVMFSLKLMFQDFHLFLATHFHPPTNFTL